MPGDSMIQGGPVFSPFEPPSKNTSALPSTPAVGYYGERPGASETGPCRDSTRWCVSGLKDTRTNRLIPDNNIQEALGMYLQPIKNDDPQLDFYTVYERETVEYDTEYMQKHNKDLNATLIFVRVWVPLVVIRVDHDFRPVSSPRSAPPSSSVSSPSSSQTLASGGKSTSERSSSASTDLFLRTRILPPLWRGVVHPERSQPLTSCMQAC